MPQLSSHSANQGILAVTCPAGEQDAQHADGRHGDDEEHADVHVNDLQALAPRQAGKGEHRGDEHQIGRELEQELVGVPQGNQLLLQDLDYVGKHLEQTPLAHTHRAQAALDPAAHLALVEDVEHGDERISYQQTYCHQHTLDGRREPTRHHAVEQLINPSRDDSEVKHILFPFLVVFVLAD